MFKNINKPTYLILAIVMSLFWPSLQALAFDLADAVAAVPNPRAENHGWVADPADAIRLGRSELNGQIESFVQENGAEVAVVVLPSIGEFAPKQFATALFNHWGVGKKGQDNGVLVLHVLDQRRIEIETGYGVEGALPDVKCRWIVDDIAIPFFRLGSFSDGHIEIVQALIAGIRNPDAERRQLTGNVIRVPGSRVDPPPGGFELLPAHPRPAESPETSFLPFAVISIIALCAGGLMLLLYPLLSWRYRRSHPDPRDQMGYFRKRAWLLEAGAAGVVLGVAAWEWQGHGSLWSILASLPAGFLTHSNRTRRIAHLRNQPRLDPATGEQMRRLSEDEDDAYLAAGQIWEEKLGSMMFDVWISPSGYYRVEQYSGRNTATACDKCGYLTFRKTGVRVLSQSTNYTEGVAEDTYECANCGHNEILSRALPSTGTSSSHDNSYSSGSSGGGSFGGGSSGGGGAGGSY